ncbi:hypothetical protein ACJX0J_015991, partial [Zea mays]
NDLGILETGNMNVVRFNLLIYSLHWVHISFVHIIWSGKETSTSEKQQPAKVQKWKKHFYVIHVMKI